MTGEPMPCTSTRAVRRARVAVSWRGLGCGGSSKRGCIVATRTGRARSVISSTEARGGCAARDDRTRAAAEAGGHARIELEKGQRRRPQPPRVLVRRNDRDAVAASRREARARPAPRHAYPAGQPALGHGVEKPAGDFLLAAEKPLEPAEIEIDDAGTAVLDRRRVGERQLEEELLGLLARAGNDEAGDACHARHSMTQARSGAARRGSARDRSTRASETRPPRRVRPSAPIQRVRTRRTDTTSAAAPPRRCRGVRTITAAPLPSAARWSRVPREGGAVFAAPPRSSAIAAKPVQRARR